MASADRKNTKKNFQEVFIEYLHLKEKGFPPLSNMAGVIFLTH